MNKGQEIKVDEKGTILIKKSVIYTQGFLNLFDYMLRDENTKKILVASMLLINTDPTKIKRCKCFNDTKYYSCMNKYKTEQGDFDVEKFIDDKIIPQKIIDYIIDEEGL